MHLAHDRGVAMDNYNMRITSAEVVPTINLMSHLRAKDHQSLPKRLEIEGQQFDKIVADIIYTQRAFVQAIKAKGSNLDIYV